MLELFRTRNRTGVYNMTNKGSITTKQVTNWMLEEGVTDKEFSFFENEEDFMDRAALTPRSNCVLDTTKAEKAGLGMRPVEDAVRDSLRKMKKNAWYENSACDRWLGLYWIELHSDAFERRSGSEGN